MPDDTTAQPYIYFHTVANTTLNTTNWYRDLAAAMRHRTIDDWITPALWTKWTVRPSPRTLRELW